MTDFLLKEDKDLKEKYYYKTLESGFRIIVIPKKLPNMFAMVSCDFGGADIEYEKDGETFSLPSGTAHFLEHKMFENADGSDAFLEFDCFGGNANAFTSYENTCYYFSCTENFFDNLRILLSSVSSLHCTDESVEKERNIINREITMYEDLPTSQVAHNLSKALYHDHPAVYPISGTKETVSEITKETLFKAFGDFYVPSNLTLCVCGDLNPEPIENAVRMYFDKPGGARPKTVYKPEPKEVSAKRIVKNAVVGTPIYSIGIKYPPCENNGLEAFRKATAVRLAISLSFGRASDFYCDNYAKGILSERFYAGFTTSRNASHIVISGSGKEYDKVTELVRSELEYRKKHFFTEEQLLREKKAAYAESITLFDSGEDLTAVMAANSRLEYDEFDCIRVLRDITADEVREALNSIDLDNISISIVTQKGTEI